MLVIADTSPLHYLVLIEHTAILPTLFGHVLVPRAVVEELQRPRTPAAERGLLDFPAAIAQLAATSFYLPSQLVEDMLSRDADRKKPM
jgi:predicted nucleic acid-binding protein